MESLQMPCEYKYSRGNGTGVAEAVGNWGFSSGLASHGNELQRLKCIVNKIENLGDPQQKKPSNTYRKRCPLYVEPSTDECKPSWTRPMKRPLMTFNSVREIIVVASLQNSAPDLAFPIPGRSYYQQGDTISKLCTSHTSNYNLGQYYPNSYPNY